MLVSDLRKILVFAHPNVKVIGLGEYPHGVGEPVIENVTLWWDESVIKVAKLQRTSVSDSLIAGDLLTALGTLPAKWPVWYDGEIEFAVRRFDVVKLGNDQPVICLTG